MIKTSLLIMAAGIGSRFGKGIKQLETIDSRAHIIMDYSVRDAIEAGFNKIIFVIRKDIEKDFKEIIGNRITEICAGKDVETVYCFQDLNDVPGQVPTGRTKPWGTGHAVYAAREVIDSPFAIINADDYYGKKGFRAVHDYLVELSERREDDGRELCMAGFVLKNTLSDHGGVTRGVCQMENGFLTDVMETKNIRKITEADGSVRADADGREIDLESLVSMNMWGLTPGFMKLLEDGLRDFFANEVPENPEKSEYLIPIYIGELLKKDQVKVAVLKTDDNWYGMTYQEDVPLVKESFRKMLENGDYTEELFEW